MDSGAYLLLIRLRRDATIAVGGLGEIAFRRGWYIYAGSAMLGLTARIARHCRRGKKLHWHIDYLLACPAAQLVECAVFPSANRLECALNRRVLRLKGAEAAAKGFGSSDCRCGCPAHLAFFKTKPDLGRFAERASSEET